MKTISEVTSHVRLSSIPLSLAWFRVDGNPRIFTRGSSRQGFISFCHRLLTCSQRVYAQPTPGDHSELPLHLCRQLYNKNSMSTPPSLSEGASLASILSLSALVRPAHFIFLGFADSRILACTSDISPVRDVLSPISCIPPVFSTRHRRRLHRSQVAVFLLTCLLLCHISCCPRGLGRSLSFDSLPSTLPLPRSILVPDVDFLSCDSIHGGEPTYLGALHDVYSDIVRIGVYLVFGPS